MNMQIREIAKTADLKVAYALFIESATNHIIGKGNLIAEIQQNSNVIYCVYDYGRVGKDGKKRAQHNKNAFAVETIKSEKIKLGCFYVV